MISADMGTKSDETFGIEAVTVGDVTVELDIGELSEAFYDAVTQIPDDTPPSKEMGLLHKPINDVLAKFGFPPIKGQTAAYKFAQEIMKRAFDLKKEACDVWRSEDEPASPHSIPDCECAS